MVSVFPRNHTFNIPVFQMIDTINAKGKGVLQVQFIGAIEFDKQRLWFFASLFDSRIVFLTIDGEMGLLVAWGGDANFVVSVGGFHPRPETKRCARGPL